MPYFAFLILDNVATPLTEIVYVKNVKKRWFKKRWWQIHKIIQTKWKLSSKISVLVLRDCPVI